MKRLCIYLTYDKQGIVDDYIGYMLGEMRTCTEYIVVICNMTEVVSGMDNLRRFSDKIIYRENIGFDAGGFKEALCKYIGWDTVLEYDELVLVNDSFFGPFIPMKDVFSEMGNRNVDFWGLAKHGTYEENGNVKFFEHIQSYFLVIGYTMLHSEQFKNYWEDMPFYSAFLDVVYQHEVIFTSYFKSLGYTYDVLANTEINDSQLNFANNYIQYAKISYELIEKRNFPFLKRQPIANHTLSNQTQENLFQAIKYIDEKTNYDINLIWNNIIRTFNMADLQRNLCLQYIIAPQERKTNKKRKTAVIVYAVYEVAIEYICEYMERLGEEWKTHVWVISENEKIIRGYRKKGIKGEILQRKNSNILRDLEKYDFVCILHDVDMTSDMTPSYIGKSYFYSVWENLLKDQNHVLGILEKFEKESRLGILAPPQPVFADYFGEFGNRWNGYYEEIERTVKKLKLNCQISEDIPPYRIMSDLWIRGDILRRTIEQGAEYCKWVPYLWSYFAQDMGYYCGIVESVDYASMNEANLSFYLNEIIAQIKAEYGSFHNFCEMKEKLFLNGLKAFCENNTRILIYGAGYYAEKYKNILSNVEACVVSDGEKKSDYLGELPIIYLSEIEEINKCGIVLCLNKKNQEHVLPILKRLGVKECFCIPE